MTDEQFDMILGRLEQIAQNIEGRLETLTHDLRDEGKRTRKDIQELKTSQRASQKRERKTLKEVNEEGQ